MPHLQKRCLFRTEDLPGLIDPKFTYHSHVRPQGLCALAVGGAMLLRAAPTATAWDLHGAIKEKRG